MIIAPSTNYEAVLDLGTSGLAGTLRVRTIDNDGVVTQAASAAGITEVAFGVYSAERTSPATRGQYTLVWDDGTDAGVYGIEDLVIGASAPTEIGEGDSYATVDELFRILKIRTPSAEQTNAGERVLLAAAGEINAEINLGVDDDPLAGWQLSLVAEVNLERAVEHWRQMEAPFGLLAIEGALGPAERTARDSWERHANKLAPLKAQWGLAQVAQAGLIALMDEMASQIRTAVASVTDVDVQVEPRMILNPTPPTIDIYPGAASRDRDSAAFDEVDGGYLFTVRARVNTADQGAGQDLLLAFMDDTNDLCLALTLLDEPTLNGLAASLDVRDPTGYRLFEHPSGEGAYLGFQFTALVLAASS